MLQNIPIGQLLVESGFISPQQLDTALVKQKEMADGTKLGDTLLSLGYVSETQLVHALATRLKVTFIDLGSIDVDVTAVRKISEEEARKHTLIAFKQSGGRLHVATNDPVNFYVFEDLKVKTGMEIHPMLATKSSIIDAINKTYTDSEQEEIVSDIDREYDANAELAKAQEEAAASDERVDNAPIVKLVNTLVESAFRSNASDVHIEPFKDRTRIRFRIDGECTEKMMVKPAVHSSLVTRFKILAGMNIAEKRIPLDGRFGMTIDGVNLDLRVSSIPTVYGEKVVVRLLSTADEKTRKVTDLGMSEYNYEMFKQIIRCPHGIMLVTGPTGSGKSTTLYATLGELSQPDNNVVTCEDPVEKKIDGVNQCQMNVKAGYTFAVALRAVLRQDPDIVMVGEIRDGETADIAIRAAITGHLVLSTLHTNDAARSILRLVDMGIAPYMVASSLVGVIAQRLVRLLCEECAEETELTDPADLRLVGKAEPITIKAVKKEGCRKCRNTGYTGRTAIFEIMVPTNAVKECISKNGTAEEIIELAREGGTKFLRDNVTEMVLDGKTTMEELVKSTYSV